MAMNLKPSLPWKAVRDDFIEKPVQLDVLRVVLRFLTDISNLERGKVGVAEMSG